MPCWLLAFARCTSHRFGHRLRPQCAGYKLWPATSSGETFSMFLGIDVSKNTLDVALLGESAKPRHKVFANNGVGTRSF